jgi:hypothetical protein
VLREEEEEGNENCEFLMKVNVILVERVISFVEKFWIECFFWAM